MNPFLRNFTTLLSGNGLAFAIQLAAAPVLTRLFSPEDFGVYANVMAVTALLAVVAGARFEQAIIRAGGTNEAAALSRFTLKTGAVISLIGVGLVYVFRDWLISRYTIDPGNLVWLVPPLAYLTLFYGVLINYITSQGNYRQIAISKIFYAIAVAGASAVLGAYGWGAEGLLYGILGGFILAILLLIPVLLKVLKSRQPGVWKGYLDFPKWNLPLAVADTLNQQFVFNLIFTSLFGVAAMGFYAITWRYVRAPVRIIQGSAAQLFYREASANKDNAELVLSHYRQTLRTTAFFALPLCVILLVAGPFLFAFIFGEEWELAGAYAQVLAPMIALGMISGSVSTVPTVYHRQRAFLFISLGGQAFALFLLWLGNRHLDLDVFGSLALFSGFSCLLFLTYLIWFRVIIKSGEHG